MDDFVSISEAARIVGVSRGLIQRRIEDGSLQLYASPLNRRVKLVRRSDIEALMRPRPIEGNEGKAAA